MAIIEVKVPQLSESVAEATLLDWHKKEGEQVSRDENLIDIETDKVVLELPAPADGVLVKIIKKAKRLGRLGRRHRPDRHRRQSGGRGACSGETGRCSPLLRRPPTCRDARRAEDRGREGHRHLEGPRHGPRRPRHQGRRPRGQAPPSSAAAAADAAGRTSSSSRPAARSSACRCRACASAWPSAWCSRSRPPRSSPRSTK